MIYQISIAYTTAYTVVDLNLANIGVPEDKHFLLSGRDIHHAVYPLSSIFFNVSDDLLLTIMSFILADLPKDIVVLIELASLYNDLELANLFQQVLQKAINLSMES